MPEIPQAALAKIDSRFEKQPEAKTMALNKPPRQLSGTNLRRHAGTFMRMSAKEGEAGTD